MGLQCGVKSLCLSGVWPEVFFKNVMFRLNICFKGFVSFLKTDRQNGAGKNDMLKKWTLTPLSHKEVSSSV